MEATQEEDLCLIQSLLKAISGQTCRRKHRNMSRNSINTKDSPLMYNNQEESIIPYLGLGHLANRAWTLSTLSKAVGNKRYLLVGTDYFTKWVEAEPLANIRDVDAKKLSGKTSSPGSGSLVLSSRTMGFSVIANPSGDIAMIWGLQIGTPPQLTLRGMDKSRLLTKS